jgi:Coatomer epsilon subunit.
MTDIDYANRSDEYNSVITSLLEGTEIVLIEAYQACGISSFLQCRIATDPSIRAMYSFYIDAKSTSDLSSALFKKMLQNPHREMLQKFADEYMGSRGGPAHAAALKAVPYIGELLSWVSTPKSAHLVYAGDYASAFEEFLVPFFKELKKRQTLLLIIDAAQEMSETSCELLRSLISHGTVQCILAITEQTAQSAKLMNNLRKFRFSYKKVPFKQPHVKLVKELGELYGHQLSSGQAEEIALRSQKNIHEILNHIFSLSEIDINNNLSAHERAVVALLVIFKATLPLSMLEAIILKCETFTPDISKDLRTTIETLIQRRFVAEDNGAIMLTTHHHPQICAVRDAFADMLIYQKIAYNYLRCDAIDVNTGLQYELSKMLRCTSEIDARPHMQALVANGGFVPTDVFINARLKEGIQEDCLLAGIALCRERRYQEALTWISSIPEAESSMNVLALRAILLNRTRNIDLAEHALKNCLKQDYTPAQKNLLAAFLISNQIHAEKVAEAKIIHNEMSRKYSGRPFHGYLIRNAASAYSDNRTELYDKALDEFLSSGDSFGYYTTLCNKGYSLCVEGDYRTSLELLAESAHGLEPFTGVNLHIVYNNLGICHMMRGEISDAYRFLSLAESFGQNSMPQLFATINLACLEAVDGRLESSLERLVAIEADVENHPLDRIRQKYYLNRLLVEYLRENKDITPLIKKASCYVDRYNPSLSTRRLNIYKRFVTSKKSVQIERWKELYSPCGLSYWYIDPLKLFSESIL